MSIHPEDTQASPDTNPSTSREKTSTLFEKSLSSSERSPRFEEESAGNTPEDQAGKENAGKDNKEKHGSKTNVFLRRVLGGDILAADWMRRQMGVILLCVICIIFYITNRYSSQHEIIEIENLQKELEEMRFYALTRSSEVTEKTRQSKIEEALQSTPDSLLRLPDKPPFLIH